jgi:hypothetical protein
MASLRGFLRAAVMSGDAQKAHEMLARLRAVGHLAHQIAQEILQNPRLPAPPQLWLTW